MEYTYTLDDFSKTTPYETLEKIEDPFLKQLAENRLEAYAKSIGFKSFKKTLASYRKTLNQSFEDEKDFNYFRFEDSGIEFRLKSWNVDESGIWRMNSKGYRECACSHLIYPTARFENIETSKEKIQLEFRRGFDGNKKTIIVDSEVISSFSKIVSLANDGVSVTSGTARYLINYLNEIINLNYDEIPLVKSVSHLGWCSGNFVPYIGGFKYDGDAQFISIYNSISEKGDLEAWTDEISRCREYNLTTRIVIAASFASCLIELLYAQPFILHLWGGSGVGKTVAQMIAASVWGDPVKGRGIFSTVKGTDSGFEFKASFLRNIPMLLDETQLLEREKFKVYWLAEGAGKTRGNKNLGLANVPVWHNAFITSGETPIINGNDGAGAINRVIEVSCASDVKIVDDGAYSAEFFANNYGFGGWAFILKLSEDKNLQITRSIYEGHRKACINNKATEKQAMAAALILTADELISDWLFGGKPLTSEDMSIFIKGAESVSSERRAYDYMLNWINLNYSKFNKSDESKANGEIYGIIEKNTVYIIRTVFDKACRDAGFNSEALLAFMKSNGLIRLRGDEKGYNNQKVVSHGAPQCSCVALILP